jgi:succinate dehydrogenase/fumarate reductase flavoprotein subunit
MWTGHRHNKEQGLGPAALQNSIQDLMWENAGPFRSGKNLERALPALHGFHDQLQDLAIAPGDIFNLDLQDWYELKAMLRSSEAVVMGALNRAESRGAHQRLDFPQTIAEFERNQLLSLEDGTMTSRWTSVVRSGMPSA